MIFLLASLSGVAFAAGNDVSVFAHLEKQSLHVGQSVIFTVVVQWQKDKTLQINLPFPPKLSRFKIINTASAVKTIKDGDKTIYEKILRYTLLAESAGDARIDPIPIEYKKGEYKNFLSTKEIRINIHPPSKSYLPLIKKCFPAIVILLILVVVIWSVVVSLQKKKAAVTQKTLKSKTLEEEALEQVKQGENLANSKEYFSLISAILREYIKKRFQLPVIRGTSSSILAALRDCEVSPDYLDRAEHIFIACDAVKFAGHLPDKEKVRQVQEDFITLIKKGGDRQSAIK